MLSASSFPDAILTGILYKNNRYRTEKKRCFLLILSLDKYVFYYLTINIRKMLAFTLRSSTCDKRIVRLMIAPNIY